MNVPRSVTQLLRSAGGGQAVPLLARVGGAVILAGLALDVAAHSLLHSAHDAPIAGVPPGEHLAHLVVVVGMVVVLAGIVADGVRMQRRLARQEGSPRHAVR